MENQRSQPSGNKIAVLHWAPQCGTETGTGKAIDAWIAASASSGVRVCVITPHKLGRAFGQEGVEHIGGNKGRVGQLICFMRGLRRTDVVHLHGGFDPTLTLVILITFLLKLIRILANRDLPLILTPHGALSDLVFAKGEFKKNIYWWLWDRWLMGTINLFLCNTPAEANQIKKRIPSAQFQIVPLMVDFPDEEYVLRDAEKLALEEVPLLCTLGRYDIGIKGLDLLIRAVVCLNKNSIPIRLRCIGYDRFGGSTELERFVNKEKGSPWIECIGPKYGTEKKRLMNEATIFCVPSRSESFSYSLMEGINAGLPILVGEGVCTVSYFNPEEKQMLVVAPNVAAWVEAIAKTLKNPRGNLQHVTRLRHVFKATCSTESVGVSLSKCYSLLVRG